MGTADVYDFINLPNVDTNPNPANNVDIYVLPGDEVLGTMVFDYYDKTVKVFVGKVNNVNT